MKDCVRVILVLAVAAAGLWFVFATDEPGVPGYSPIVEPIRQRAFLRGFGAADGTPIRKHLTQEDGRVSFSIRGLNGSAGATVVAFKSGERAVPLWKAPLPPGALTGIEIIPAGVPVDIVVAESPSTPRQVQTVSVEEGETARVVFDYSQYCQCTLRVSGLPVEFLKNATLSIQFNSVEIGTRPDGMTAQLDSNLSVVVSGSAGRVFSASILGAANIPLVGPSGDQFSLIDKGTVDLHPAEAVYIVGGQWNGVATKPIAAWVGGDLFLGQQGLLVVPESKAGDSFFVLDLNGRYARWEKSRYQTDVVNLVDLQPPDGKLEVMVDAPPDDGLDVFVFGPDGPKTPTPVWGSQDPRVHIERTRGGVAGFDGLPPGYYSVRLQERIRGRSPVLTTVPLQPGESRRISIDYAGLRPHTYSVRGLLAVALHIGKLPKHLVPTLGGQRLHLVDAETDIWQLEHWGPLGSTEIVLHEPAVLSPLPTTIISDSAGTTALQVSSAVLRWNLELLGDHSGLRIGSASSPLGVYEEGEVIGFVSATDAITLQIWRRRGEEMFHGFLSLDRQQMSTGASCDTSGHIVEVTILGGGPALQVQASSAGKLHPLGVVVPALGGRVYRLWASHYIDEVLFMRNGEVVARIERPERMRDAIVNTGY
ncbi:MAG: hypothetical protein J5J06_19765 [Phycisphaerae bacterium]|nr:hypothetical protein [Phycisphaerae bacterium]